MMKTSDSCAACLYRRQKEEHNDPEYLRQVKEILDHRRPSDSSPYLSDKFRIISEKMFGPGKSLAPEKRKFNDLVLGMEDALWEKIQASEDPLKTAVLYSRVGNYIDFGTVDVDEKTFLGMFDKACMSKSDLETYAVFREDMKSAENFVLLADNCGEIVLDKLLIRELKQLYPGLHASVVIRGAEVLNDVTEEDAVQVRLADVADVIPNGIRISATIYDLVNDESKRVIDEADVIVSKGLGNYEGFTGSGIPAYYLFLCKCDLFTERFQVPLMTGMFVKE